MTDHDESALGPTLDAAARHLRQPVPVREAWRDALLSRIEADGVPAASHPRRVEGASRVWTFRPPVAIAAGLALMAVGAGAAIVVRGKAVPIEPTPVAERAAVAGQSVVRFVYVAPGARSVTVVGDFNAWNPRAVPLRRLSDGRTWIAELPLAPGRYTYAFSVDGVLQSDPTAAHEADQDFGGGVVNSVVMVRGS